MRNGPRTALRVAGALGFVLVIVGLVGFGWSVWHLGQLVVPVDSTSAPDPLSPSLVFVIRASWWTFVVGGLSSVVGLLARPRSFAIAGTSLVALCTGFVALATCCSR